MSEKTIVYFIDGDGEHKKFDTPEQALAFGREYIFKMCRDEGYTPEEMMKDYEYFAEGGDIWGIVLISPNKYLEVFGGR